ALSHGRDERVPGVVSGVEHIGGRTHTGVHPGWPPRAPRPVPSTPSPIFRTLHDHACRGDCGSACLLKASRVRTFLVFTASSSRPLSLYQDLFPPMVGALLSARLLKALDAYDDLLSLRQQLHRAILEKGLVMAQLVLSR